MLPVHAEVNVTVHCGTCDNFVEAVPLAVEDEDGEPNRYVYFEDEADLAWVRRRRLCLQCGTTFLTAEVDEGLILEFRRLRQEVTELRVLGAGHKSTKSFVPPWMLVPAPEVPAEYAEELVRRAAWWLDHPSGPVRAPRMAEKLQHVPTYGWCVPYGANWFAAAYAIHQTGAVIADAAAKQRVSEPMSESSIKCKIHDVLWSSVLNHEGELYPPCSYRKDNNDLIFGVHSIDIEDATSFLLNASGLAIVAP